ncbi:hypothetical protein EVAR_66773_1 [Eumeta japonica]|uniref:Uncharacterized protein n=1 Tax=Eumeta variegata TaxID=151549 RepID=A0A4C1ZY47_EUMVA|nr:hypothetical protein EVAR_66773_1 [Eumeta japonica]
MPIRNEKERDECEKVRPTEKPYNKKQNEVSLGKKRQTSAFVFTKTIEEKIIRHRLGDVMMRGRWAHGVRAVDFGTRNLSDRQFTRLNEHWLPMSRSDTHQNCLSRVPKLGSICKEIRSNPPLPIELLPLVVFLVHKNKTL